MKRVLTATGVLLVLGAMIVPSSALAAKAPATIIFDYDSFDGADTYTYGGSIDSPSSKCDFLRKVTVYREEGPKDKKLGKDKALPNISNPEDPARWGIEDSVGGPGEYYAVAKKTKKCKKAVSNLYVVEG